MSERRAEDIGMSGYLSRADMEAATTEADGWIEWAGEDGFGPVPPETEIVVRVRDGYEHQSMTAGFWAGDGSRAESNWLYSGEDYDIIAYRVVPA